MRGYIWNDVRKLKRLRYLVLMQIFSSWNIFPPLQVRCGIFPQKEREPQVVKVGDEKPRVETWNNIFACNLTPPWKRRSSMKTDQFNLLIGKWEGFPANLYPPKNLYCINFYYSPNHIRNAPHVPIIPVLKTQPSAYIEKPHHLRRVPELSMGIGMMSWVMSHEWDHRKPTFCWDYWSFAWYLPNYMGLGWLNDLWFWIDINLTNQHYSMVKIRAPPGSVLPLKFKNTGLLSFRTPWQSKGLKCPAMLA